MPDHTDTLNQALPLLPLRHGVVLPGGVTTIPVGRSRSRALAQAVSTGDHLVIAVQRDAEVEEPAQEDVHPIGVLARVKDRIDRGRRGILLVVEPLVRVRPTRWVEESPFARVEAEPAEESGADDEMARERADAIRAHLEELGVGDDAFREALAQTSDPGRVADRVAAALQTEDAKKAEVLTELDVPARLERVVDLLVQVKGKAELRHRIDEEVRREMTSHQKEMLLRQQLRAIQKELGEDDEGDDLERLRKRLDETALPEEARRVANRELKRLEGLGPNQAEANVIRTYLEWIADLPWERRADTSFDLDAVARVLDDDHFGLEDVKKRVLEHMAVLKLSGQRRGTILCLAGPPGVGKTSLAQSVANATGRPLQRVSLGGVRDEAEIRGHRRTYVGALPGRILNALRKAEANNPVIVLDEIDKLGRGWAGDPEAALLEVLDPAQNAHFVDHYLELPFDLSEVMFIATANDLSTLSPPLRDRLEVIEVTGYTQEEKREIARRHLLPEQLSDHGLPEDALTLDDEVLDRIVSAYTREAGVRQLAQQLAKICRAVALEVARRPEGEVSEPSAVGTDDLKRLLGRPRFFQEMAEAHRGPGVAAGLAWTPTGGDVLFVETTRMPGKGRLEITGQLGDVMQESARAAMAYLRSHAEELGVDPRFLEENDLHIHVPAGAVPKDGPSAGVTIFTALASLLTGRPVRSDTAMTGEATLRGRVLPVGGIKSKVLAAHRAGYRRVILPKRNEGDWDDVPASAAAELDLVLAEDMREVIAAALEPEAEGKPCRRVRSTEADSHAA